jgi:hypothetical protein
MDILHGVFDEGKMRTDWRFILNAVLMVVLVSGRVAAASDLTSASFEAKTAGEAVLEIKLSAPGYSWSGGPWRQPLEILLDGKFLSSLIPFRGSEIADYNLFLGPVGVGEHEVRLVDPAEPKREVKIDAFAPAVLSPGDTRYDAIRFAPVLLGRDDNESTDVPLIMWVVEKKKPGKQIYGYTMVWSNEDGGTATDELMSRYGRTVDIELIYTVEVEDGGVIFSEKIQSEGHEVVDFAGDKIGSHPVLRTCTKNNMVCAGGESNFVFMYAPVDFDDLGARERMLDRNPWINRIAYEELAKEKKLARMVPDLFKRTDDPRRYALLDMNIEQLLMGPRVEVALKLRGRDTWYTSDMGQERMAENVVGWVRVGVWLPNGTAIGDVESIRLSALDEKGGKLYIRSAGPLILLGEDFKPNDKPVPWNGKQLLSAEGKPVVISLPQ